MALNTIDHHVQKTQLTSIQHGSIQKGNVFATKIDLVIFVMTNMCEYNRWQHKNNHNINQ